MAGGYNGNLYYPDRPEYNSTLKLVNNEYFEESETVSLNHHKTCIILKLAFLSPFVV